MDTIPVKYLNYLFWGTLIVFALNNAYTNFSQSIQLIEVTQTN